MCNKKFKLIATAVGLVAVLALGLAVPGATQQPQPLPTRNQIVQGLSQILSASLTASEGDILDVENAVFGSTPSLKRIPSAITLAYIPLHPSSRSVQLLHNWLFRDEPFGDYLNVGALYAGEDFPGCSGYDPLPTGVYHLKVNKGLKVIAFDSEGREFVIGYVKKRSEAKESFPDTALAPIGRLNFLLLLCGAGDVQICWRTKECTRVKDPRGGEVEQCRETEFCISC